MSRAPQFPKDFFDTDFASAARHAASPRECIRLSGLALLQKRLPVKKVAETFNVTKDAVHDWLSRFRRKGIEGVKDQKGRGRKRLLPLEKEQPFKAAVLQAQQEKKGGSITGRDVTRLLQKQFDIRCSLSTTYNLLHQVHLSWISGRSKHPKQDIEVQKTFKKTLSQG